MSTDQPEGRRGTVRWVDLDRASEHEASGLLAYFDGSPWSPEEGEEVMPVSEHEAALRENAELREVLYQAMGLKREEPA